MDSSSSSLSASLGLGSSLGPGKVRAMFQARRTGNSPHGSPVGWDKSYPLQPISRSEASSTASGQSDGGRRRRSSSHEQLRRTGGRRQARSKSESRRRRPASPPGPGGSTAASPPGPAGGTSTRALRQQGRHKINTEISRREDQLLRTIRSRNGELNPVTSGPAARVRSKKPAAASKEQGRSRIPDQSRSREPARQAAGPPSRTPAVDRENQEQAPLQDPRPPPVDPNMAQCTVCTRSFAKDRLQKHQEICQKSNSKKRKAFDPVKMRVQGTESEKFLRQIKQADKKPPPAPPKQDWRKQHEEFVSNIRAAREMQSHVAAGGRVEDLPAPPPLDTTGYVSCPHCSRSFSAAAADRHIPKCASIASNKPTAVVGRRTRKR